MTPELDSPAPVAPAASLLFQAPVFQEPAGAGGPDEAPSRRTADAGDDPKEASPRRRRSSRTAPEDGAGADAKGVPDDDGAAGAPPKKRRTRKRSSAEAPSADGEGTGPQEDGEAPAPKRRRRAKKEDSAADPQEQDAHEAEGEGGRRRRRRRPRSSDEAEAGGDLTDQVKALKGSTRLEAKKQRRREGRREGRRRHSITESEFLARRESVKRSMVIRDHEGLDQIAILEDDLLVEHYVARRTSKSAVGNIYLGRVQNVLPSMEAAFVDIGKGRNAVLYAGEVNWEAAGLEGKPRRIEQALKSGDVIMVQVTKDPIGHKGARLTAQITLAGRHLVLVPSGAMTGISRKLPDKERQRLKRLLRELIPSEHGVIVRTAAEGASEEQLRADVERLTKTWEDIRAKAKNVKSAPTLLKGEPELAVRVVRDVFNEDFLSLRIQGAGAWKTISGYVRELSPELTERLEHWTGATDIFVKYRVDEQLAKAFDRKVWLPSGGTLIIDRTEAMTVIDVNTGKFTGSGGTLEETVTRNNLEAAEEIVRQLRLRDIGGIIVIDFIDMVLEANRELVLRRLVECLGRDRTRHQVAEVTSLGLVQMTRKRVGQGLVEAFSTVCQTCEGRGFITHAHPVERNESGSGRSSRKAKAEARTEESKRHEVKDALNSIAAAASKHDEDPQTPPAADASDQAKAGAKKASAGKSARGGQSRVRARGRKSSAAEQAGVAGGEPEKPAAEDAPKAGEPSAGAEAPAEGGPNASGAGEGEAAAARGADGAETPDAVATPDGQGGEESPDEPDGKGTPEDARSRKHRVSSSGTITPGASQASAILSFPAK